MKNKISNAAAARDASKQRFSDLVERVCLACGQPPPNEGENIHEIVCQGILRYV